MVEYICSHKLLQWAHNWELALNINKCSVCRFGRNIAIKSDYYINDIKLQEVHTVEDLGVTFGEQLKFSDHCYDKIKKSLFNARANKKKFQFTL